MKKHLYPDYYFHAFSEIDPEFFLVRGITHVIFDIDDTLVAHGIAEPTEEVIAFLRSFQEAGLVVSLISNSRAERAETFNRSLDLFAIGHAKKPSKRALTPFFEHYNVKADRVAMVGDQLFTDVLLAKRCGLLTVLVEPIAPFENFFFYIKRALERPILKSIFRRFAKENETKENRT